jgi:hypothetical protein
MNPDEVTGLREYVRGMLAVARIEGDPRIETSGTVNDSIDAHGLMETLKVILPFAAGAVGREALGLIKDVFSAHIKQKMQAKKMPKKVLLVDKDGKPLVEVDDHDA